VFSLARASPHPRAHRRGSLSSSPNALSGESKKGLIMRAHHNWMRHWPTSEDFQRQCDHFQVDHWGRNFLADAHDLKMDRLARQSGFHAPVELKKMAIALLQRDRAIAGLAAAGLAAAGRKRRARSSTIVGGGS
jgi:hypothetical protein